MSRLIAPTVLAVILLASGCGSSAEPNDAAIVDSTDPASTEADNDTKTTTTAAPTTVAPTTAAPTTAAARASVDPASCVVGEWELDSEAFVESIAALIADGTDDAASMSFTGGTHQMTVERDGSWSSKRENWTLEIEVVDLGVTRITVNGVDEGTYTVTSEADVATMTVDVTNGSSEMDMVVIVDGNEIALPAGSQQVDVDPLSGSGVLTCDQDTMSVAAETEGETIRSVFERVG